MLGSEKCYQLASALSSIATSVPYEDVQTAATQLIQCATNVLTVTLFFIIIKMKIFVFDHRFRQ